MAIGVYNLSNEKNRQCGTVNIETSKTDYCFSNVRTMNFTAPEGSVKFTAKPAEGYVFKGWYRGTIGSSAYVEEPSDELLCVETEYTCAAGEAAVCAVFECSGHQWEQNVQKATLDADGNLCQTCRICKTEKDVVPIPRVSNISLEGTSFTYTGNAIEPKVIVASSGEALSEDQYTVEYSNNVNAGTANVKVTLKGDYYEGSTNLTFTITKPEDSGNNNPRSGGPAPTSETTGKMANPMTVKGKTVTLRYSKLQKKAQGIKSAKAITISDAKGKITYKLAGVTKKKFRKFFKVNAQTGKITVKKGLKKGIYKVKVKVKAEGDNDYLASDEKTVTIKVKVK